MSILLLTLSPSLSRAESKVLRKLQFEFWRLMFKVSCCLSLSLPLVLFNKSRNNSHLALF